MTLTIALHIIAVVACFASGTLTALKSTHIFQLNSYKSKVQLKWIKTNWRRFIPNILALVIAVIGAFTNSVGAYIAFYAVAILNAIAGRPLKNAKKPLVYTARVKRLLASTAVMVAVLLGLTFLGKDASLFGVCIVLALMPFAVLAGNAVNAPVEKAIRQHYINDAKKMLKACPDLKVIGITGSYGKTSVKYYLSTVLKAKYNVLMTPESFNTPMGVVKTIREQLRPTHEIFVCEMGARNVNDIKEICDIVFPDYGIITSIGEQHLESFKTIDNIVKTKFELYDAVENKENMFLNGDNENISNKLASLGDGKCHTYGLNSDNEAYAYDISVSQRGTTFSVFCRGQRLERLQTPLIGEHNVTNILGVISICLSLGLSEDDIRIYLRKLTSPPHRLQLSRRGANAIIDDAYNSNPAGCKAALNTLALFPDVKILITPGMVELGDKQYECNYEFGRQAAEVCDYVYLIGKKQTEPIYNGLADAGFPKEKITVAGSFIEGFNSANAVEYNKPKVILIENDLPDNY